MTGTARIFVSDAGRAPRRAADWERLADFAVELRDQHVGQVSTIVAKGRMTQAQADARTARLTALAELWRRAVASEPLPAVWDWEDGLGAPWQKLHDDMALYARHAADRARAAPGDSAARQRAEWTEALWWHLRPVADGALPHIALAADFAWWQHNRPTKAQAA